MTTPHRPTSARWRAAAIACSAMLALSVTAFVPAPTVEAPAGPWADAAAATIHPGVQLVTDGSQCTANFIFERFVPQADGSFVRELFIGYAAHCAGLGGSTDTNGCLTGSAPLGTTVKIDGATKDGTLAYSSWGTMAANNDSNSDRCSYNDFALVKIDPADHSSVNPSVPQLGGPVALGSATAFGSRVYSYGNSGLRFGLSSLSPKTGYSLGTSRNGWSHTVYTATPGIPGDSGSGFMDANGRAFGVTSTVAIAPYAGSNGISDLRLGLAYANANTAVADYVLAPGTESFVGYP
jgi:hypothetical protein